ncbi:transmembrane protein 184C [Macrosteles quadrilineatus]|uniref:transmembrane protein 184C n=1 Tax=Macrosteles quadrilineatus TaxID=74068 RepID=UPI0023E278A1|nr:transmembrane protein 184C [Macrosteles quadrilineatus]
MPRISLTGNGLRNSFSNTFSDVLSKWRNWIKAAVMVIYGIFMLLLIPKLIIHSFDQKKKNPDPAAYIGGFFAVLTIPISLTEIIQHMIHYSSPPLQLHIIRILWMVPIYTLNAWMGIIYPDQTIFMDSFRECYEAYVIYNFMMYLLNYLNAESDFETQLATKPQVNHIFPFCWLSPWKMGRELVHNCKHGILQYTVVRPLTTAIALLCDLCGVYGEGEFEGDKAFPYIIAVNNCSQFIAMYCLVLFYKANRDQLRPMKPIGKFLCIKAVVFFSFFQGVVIAVLVYMNVISSVFETDSDDDVRDISSKIQNFLICIEMFFAAIAHRYSFSHKPYEDGMLQHQTLCETLMAMWDLRDVHDNIKEHFTVVGSGLESGLNTLKRARSETSPLLADVSRSMESGYQSFTDILNTAEGAVVEGAAHKDEDDDPEAELHPTPYQEIDSDTAIA